VSAKKSCQSKILLKKKNYIGIKYVLGGKGQNKIWYEKIVFLYKEFSEQNYIIQYFVPEK